MFYLYQILVSFTGFSLEVRVGRSGPALVCLWPLSLLLRGTRLQDTGLGTLDAGPSRCALLLSVRRWCVSACCLWDGAVKVRWTQVSWRSLILDWLMEDGTLNKGWNALCRTERSTEDRALFARRNSWWRTGRSSQDRTLGRGQNAQRRVEWSTQDWTLDGRQSAWRSTRNSTEDGALDAGLRTLAALLCLKSLNNQRSSLSFVSERSTLFSVWSSWTLDTLLFYLSLNALCSPLSVSTELMEIIAITNRRSRIDIHKPTLTNRRLRTDAYEPTLTFSLLAGSDKPNQYPFTNRCSA